MKKKFLTMLALMVMTACLCAVSAFAMPGELMYVNNTNGTGVNMRSGPGTGYAIVATYPNGTEMYVVTADMGSGWTQVSFDSTTGWMATYLLSNNRPAQGGASGTFVAGDKSGQYRTITGQGVNLRSGPGTNYSKVTGCAQVPKGATVTLLEYTSSDNGWYKVIYGSYTGYLSADYVAVAGSGVNTPGSTGNNVSGSGVGTQYAKYTGTSADIWGSMSVAGTNISDNIYCNAMNSKGQFVYNAYSSSKNNLYALSYLTDPIAVIYGHNMRKVAKKQTTNLGLHELHHVQNAWLGKAKCEYCGRSCSGAKTSTFNISYNGSSSWTLVGFFELSNSTMSSAAQRKKIQTYASFNSTLTGSAKQQWVDTMMSYCNSKYLGATLGSISGSDKVMVIITCADKSGSKNQSMYMILKGN